MHYTGLSERQVIELQKHYGSNSITARNTHPWYRILFEQFQDILVIILILAAVITGFQEEIVDTIVILFIVVLNGGIGFFQEYRTEKTLLALQKMVVAEIRVIRESEEIKIDVSKLVPGDVVILSEGDKVPADARLVESHSLRIEEAALTGESVPVSKSVDDFVYMGTGIAKGSGVCIVEHIGNATRFGEIATLAVETEKVDSPLQKELKNIGKFVAKITLVICIILFAIVAFRDGSTHLVENLIYAVSIAIAAVPEGLPTTITIALALGASVLAGKSVIVKKLGAVETLGAVTTICSDKTGTLTKNQMTVREVLLANGEKITIEGAGYDPRIGSISEVKAGKILFEKLRETLWKCNESDLREEEDTYSILGDPTEGALLTLVAKSDPTLGKQEKNLKNIFPFDSERKMMSVVTETDILVKGSPDHVLERVTQIMLADGRARGITDTEKKTIKTAYTSMASRALRVLMVATRTYTTLPNSETEAEQDLTYIGLVAMIDPPREEAYHAVQSAKNAGIRIIVITGDSGTTAGAIAHELAIIKDPQKNVYTADDLTTMTDEALKKLLAQKESLIFSRSQPRDKMRIVSLLQENGEVVAMTGDGVNDAPALKKSDIGIAMGITGTEVSKESATMVLMNDSFASIVVAIEEGRRIYQNLKKFIWYMFSSNTGELVTLIMTIVLFIPNALTAILILCINLGTDILPAISMGIGPADRNNMSMPPRNPKSRILSRGFVIGFLLTGVTIGAVVITLFLVTLMGDGWSWEMGTEGDWRHATTVAFAGLVIIQMVNTFSAIAPETSVFQTNYLRNPYHLGAVALSVLFVLAIVYIPWMNTILKTTPLSSFDWMLILIASCIPMFLMELRKKFFMWTIIQ